MRRSLLALLLLALPATPLAAQTGVVRGRVSDPAGAPLAGATVHAQRVRAVTDSAGRFALSGLAPGTVRVRAGRLGSETQERAVEVAADGAAEVDFVLPLQAIIVDYRGDTVAWHTGPAGAAVHGIRPDSAGRVSAESFSELVQGRAPGLFVRRASGSVGAASFIEMRGPTTISLHRSPLLVVDGVRTASENVAGLFDVDGLTPISGYDDLDPDQVESVAVLPGPAAAALYGPAGASGVIEVRTRRGAPGRPRWRAFAEAGAREDPGGYPANFAQIGRTPAGVRVANCLLVFRAASLCTPLADSLVAFSPLDQASPFRTGARRGAGFGVDGGGGRVSYAAGAGLERALGVLEENDETRWDLRGRVTVRPLAGVEVTAHTAHVRRDQRLPYEGNNSLSIVLGGLLGTADEALRSGYRPPFTGPDADFYENTLQTWRATAGLEAAWSAREWLTLGGRFGIDRLGRDQVRTRQTLSSVQPAFTEGAEVDRELRDVALEAAAALGRPDALGLRATLGVERLSDRYAARERSTLSTTPTESAALARRVVLGAYLRPELAWRGTVRLDGVLRRDEPRSRDALWSASLGAAWSLADEWFFPAPEWLSGLTLRAAWGRIARNAETAPGLDRQGELTLCPLGQACVAPAPQRSEELEGGLDAALFGGRLGVGLTAYRRHDRDVVVFERLPGEPAVPSFHNGADVRNAGAELALRARLVDRASLGWEVELLGAANRNRVTRRSGPFLVTEPVRQRIQEGYPLGAYFALPLLSWGDRDGDGLIDAQGCFTGNPDCEVVVGREQVYLGAPLPTRMLALASRLRLGQRVTLSARLEHQGGARLWNAARQLRCASLLTCREAVEASAPLEDQAAVVAGLLGVNGPFVEDADFVKLREVALTLSAPPAWTRRIGAAGVELTVAGRNLATWTPYSGLDPEVNAYVFAAPTAVVDLGSPPLPRTVTTRVEVRF
ncbi:MAG TPA: TonB-dependent receptor [Longimicrobium sp.]|jgi:hypothetical protein